jgi:DNA replication ATP-dependent helicase Dna2
VTTKAYVHVIGIFDSSGHCIVDDNTNLLILHPDHLISATVIADSFGCTRRAVLQDRVKATNDYSAPLVYGTILHEIFQAAMLANRWDTEWLRELIEKVAIRHLEDLYVIDRPIPVAVEYLQSKMPELQSWAELFVSAMPKVCFHSLCSLILLTLLSPRQSSKPATVRQLICVLLSCLMLRSTFGHPCTA